MAGRLDFDANAIDDSIRDYQQRTPGTRSGLLKRIGYVTLSNLRGDTA